MVTLPETSFKLALALYFVFSGSNLVCLKISVALFVLNT